MSLTQNESAVQLAPAPEPSVFNWRKYLHVHPAAELFPLMRKTDPAGFKDFVEDIRVAGLKTPLAMWTDLESGKTYLADGRNRLDALAELGRLGVNERGVLGWCVENKWLEFVNLDSIGGDPYALVISYNIHRRHLDSDEKNDLIRKVLAAKPKLSNRQIGEITKTDKKKVGAVRAKMEATGEISPVEKTVGKDGKARKQPTKRKAKAGEKSNSVAKSDSTAVSPMPIEPAINTAPEAKPALATKPPDEAGTETETEAKTETEVMAAAPETSAEPVDREKIIELAGQARALLQHPTAPNIESVKGLLTKICRLCTKPTTKIIRASEEKKPELNPNLLPKALGLNKALH